MLNTKQQGFTLVELMVVIAILAILLGIGIPWANNYMINARINTGANELRDGLQYARMEAIRQNRNIVFNLTTNPLKWEVKTTETTPTVLRNFEFSSSVKKTVSIPATNITFTSTGRVVTSTAQTLINVTNSDSAKCQPLKTGDSAYSGTGELVCLRVLVTSGGVIKTCNPSAAANNTAMACG